MKAKSGCYQRWKSRLSGSEAITQMICCAGNACAPWAIAQSAVPKAIVAILVTTCPVGAQIVPDKTLPVNSSVTPLCTACTIEGGTVRGNNLFHSFKEFSVPTGGEAFFNNPTQIQNILTRVTGNSVSNIDGLIRASGKANLFFINPNGIIFGPNARLNIGGSFVGSTASSLVFTDGTNFSVPATPTTPLLTITVPVGLQYGSNAGSVQVQGSNLQMAPGRTLALVGGNVSMDAGGLYAFGGRVELGGLAGAGTVELNANGSQFSLSFPDGVGRSDILLTNGAIANVRADNGGSIAINARSLELAGDSSLKAGIADGLGAVNTKAGNIEVNAQAAVNLKDGSFISNALLPGATGKSGDVSITTGSLSLTNGAQLNANTSGQGDAGKVIITARDTVSFDGVDDEGYSSSVLNGTAPGSVGKGGEISITTGSLSVRNGAKLSVRTFGNGDAGSITITARDAVSFDGVGSIGPSGAFSSVIAGAVGKGGDISITTGSLTVRNGAQLNASSNGQGAAGEIKVSSGSIKLDNQAGILATTASGNGGNITLRNQDLLLLRRASQISTTAGTASAGGDGGNITINAPSGFIVANKRENSDITANAFTGAGGRVQINSSGIFGFQFREKENPQTSEITASSQFGVNGIVQINTPNIDPSQSLAELPTNLIDAFGLIANRCIGRSNQTSGKLIITGNGGLPVMPDDPLVASYQTYQIPTLQNASVSTRQQKQNALTPENTATGNKPERPTSTPLVEANGWVYGPDGEVILIAHTPTVAPSGSRFSLSGCSGS